MIHHGHVLDVLRTLKSGSVQCVVTSPPYWALRRYDIPDVVFDGEPHCEHVWSDMSTVNTRLQDTTAGPKQQSNSGSVGWRDKPNEQGVCQRCGAWRGQLGQEPTPTLFVQHLVDIFREVRRVLRDDGTCWINMGDCYASSSTYNTTNSLHSAAGWKQDAAVRPNAGVPSGLKPKDLVGVPWTLAFALRDDGWYLRAEIVWAKGMSFNPEYAGSVMPESVTDRPTRAHEQFFLLAKNERYFYDHEAVKEEGVYPAGTRAAKGSGTREGNRRGNTARSMMSGSPKKQDGHGKRHAGFNERYFSPDDDGYATYDGKRNLRTVWAIGVEPFTEAHFATYPPALVEPCILAGTSEKGACAACGAPWERIVDYAPLPPEIKAQFEAARAQTADDHGRTDGFVTRKPNYQRKKIGQSWVPTCDCGEPATVPCVVLDPFAGSGSTGVAAQRLLRQFVGIDLGTGYVEMAKRRIESDAPLLGAVVESAATVDDTPTSGSLFSDD